MSILNLKCEVAALRFTLAVRRLSNLLCRGGFNPDQPRDDRGRWTDAGAGDPDGGADDGQVILVGGPGARSGYPVDILDEDALGGHTYERHVGKSEDYLRARVVGSRTNLAGIFTVGERRAGSFTSLEAANKLINSTLAENGNRVDAFAAGRFPPSLPFMFVFADFDRPTGYEAFAANDRAQPRMRPTLGLPCSSDKPRQAKRATTSTRLGRPTGIEAMVPSAPPAFKRMCQNFGPDLAEIVSSWEELSLLALHNLEISEARSLVPFIEELLSDRYSDEDLKEFWWTMPVTTVFDSGNDVRRLLKQIRQALSDPPYAEER